MESLIIGILTQKRPPAVVGYVVSAAMVLAVLAVEFTYSAGLHRYIIFLPVVFVSTVLFGRNAGVFTTLMSGLLGDSIYYAVAHGTLPGRTDVFFLLLFLALGLVTAVLVEALHDAVCKVLDKEAEAKLLLDELTHRSRNDLMMIASVLGLQASRQQDPQTRSALDSAISRIRVIAQTQDRLRTSGKRGSVELAGYLQAMGVGLGDLLRDVRPIAVQVDAQPMMVEASAAVSIGLIANELVTNAFKYAFPDGRDGTVQIRLQTADTGVALVVEDDGVGLAPSRKQGLGSRLVYLLASHLGGTVECESAQPGHRVRVTLPVAACAPENGAAITG